MRKCFKSKEYSQISLICKACRLYIKCDDHQELGKDKENVVEITQEQNDEENKK